MGGGPPTAKANPSYEDVCSGVTGHVEVFHMFFDGSMDTYELMCRFFFQFHDPTTPNQQGNDKGTQYASVIFAYTQAQFDMATAVKAELNGFLKNGTLTSYKGIVVMTDIRLSTSSSDFFEAKAEHQEFLANNPKGYCNHRLRFQHWPSPKS